MSNILVIDDNKDLAEMLSKYLVINNHKCTTSHDGVIGLSLIKNGLFDYIILDLTMPNFSGINVIDALEKEKMLHDKKIIILTASDIKQEEINALMAKDGILVVLKKPVELKDLLTVISN